MAAKKRTATDGTYTLGLVVPASWPGRIARISETYGALHPVPAQVWRLALARGLASIEEERGLAPGSDDLDHGLGEGQGSRKSS